jgi:hypothetical protein
VQQGSLKDKTLKIFKCCTWDVKIAFKQWHVNILGVLSFKQLWCAIPEHRNYNNINWCICNTKNHVFEVVIVNVILTTNRQDDHHEALEIVHHK